MCEDQMRLIDVVDTTPCVGCGRPLSELTGYQRLGGNGLGSPGGLFCLGKGRFGMDGTPECWPADVMRRRFYPPTAPREADGPVVEVPRESPLARLARAAS